MSRFPRGTLNSIRFRTFPPSKSEMPSDYAKKKAAKKKEAAKAKGGKKSSKADEVESEVEKASSEEPTSASNGVENGVKSKEMTEEGERFWLILCPFWAKYGVFG